MFLPTFAKSLFGIGCGALLLACSSHASDDESKKTEDATGEPPAPTTEAAPVPTPPPSPLPSGLNLPGDTAPPPGPGTPPVTPPSTPPSGRTLYATDAKGQLVTFTSGAPSKITARAVAGVDAGERIVGLSYGTGKLSAIGTTSHMFLLDTQSAAATRVSSFPFAQPLDGEAFGFAIDPVSKLARVVSNTRENIRIDATGTVTNVDGALTYVNGDPNAALVPYVVAAAYTAAGKAYAIDTRANVLVELVDSYSGQMRTVGALGVDPGDIAGFDIDGADAFAALRVGNATGLYKINLTTGAATSAGTIGVDTAISGLAIAP